MRVLIYGNTYLSSLVARAIPNVVGYVPSINPTFKGDMPVSEVSPDTPHDIILSVQYDKKINPTEHTYNLHTGLLPDYGGCDILYHTLENKEIKQGLTFHKITHKFDEGGIVSRIEYPVFENDTVLDLYKRMCAIAPTFVQSCLTLLPLIENETLYTNTPKLYYRGRVENKEKYENDRKLISEYVKM
jgi:methionyl-tRNA formyltransferase